MTDIYKTDTYVQSVIDDVNKILMKIPGVVGTGITHSYITGIGDEYQILVYIRDESVISLLPNSVYGMRIVWSVVGEIKVTAFVETAEEYEKRSKSSSTISTIRSMQKEKYRPIVGGISGGIFAAVKSTGTIGCIAKESGGSGRNILISNNHVFAYDIGTIPYKGMKGDPIIQPGSADGGIIDDKVATLEKWIPITLTGNIIDAAYAIPTVSTNTPNLCNLYTGSSVDPVIGMVVSKGGRTTGCVSGTIESIKVTSKVTYTIKTSTGDINFTAQFSDLIVITGTGPVSQSGDSGSIWVTSNGNNVVGLNFAGDATGASFSCKAKNIESLLGVVFGNGSGGGGGGSGCNSPTVNLTIGDSGGGNLKFACKDVLDSNGNILGRFCLNDPAGQYNSIQECNAACPIFRYTCKELLDNNGNVLTKYCTFDSNGQYTSFIDCENKCK